MGSNSTAINQSQGLYVLVKKAVVPKEFEHLRRTGRSRRPIGPPLWTDIVSRGFSSY